MDLEKRLANFKNMAEADPDNELAHFSLGKLYFETKAFDEAENSLRRTLALSPRHSLAHRFLGETLLAKGDKDAAVEVWKTGVLIAHEKGEFMPRNQMTALLEKAGIEPPALPQSEQLTTSTSAASGDFVCRRCGQANPPLDNAPFKNKLGESILETICQSCWKEWMAMSVKVINELRLNLMAQKDSDIYDQHLKEFLGL